MMELNNKQELTDQEMENVAGGMEQPLTWHGEYVCPICGDEFDGFGELDEHIKTCTGK